MVKEPQASVYTRYRCSLPVPEPSAHSQYTVSVKHLEQGKFIMSYYHIQMEPPILNQTKNRDSYSLHWETQKMAYSFIEHTFQVQYKKKSDSWEDSKTENLDRAHSMDLSQLEPDTSYCARVRVKPISNYDGIWSKWSEEYTWKTDWGRTGSGRKRSPTPARASCSRMEVKVSGLLAAWQPSPLRTPLSRGHRAGFLLSNRGSHMHIWKTTTCHLSL